MRCTVHCWMRLLFLRRMDSHLLEVRHAFIRGARLVPQVKENRPFSCFLCLRRCVVCVNWNDASTSMGTGTGTGTGTSTSTSTSTRKQKRRHAKSTQCHSDCERRSYQTAVMNRAKHCAWVRVLMLIALA